MAHFTVYHTNVVNYYVEHVEAETEEDAIRKVMDTHEYSDVEEIANEYVATGGRFTTLVREQTDPPSVDDRFTHVDVDIFAPSADLEEEDKEGKEEKDGTQE